MLKGVAQGCRSRVSLKGVAQGCSVQRNVNLVFEEHFSTDGHEQINLTTKAQMLNLTTNY